MIFNLKTAYHGINLKSIMLVIITATISSLSYAEAKETNYTFSCKGMHGGRICLFHRWLGLFGY